MLPRSVFCDSNYRMSPVYCQTFAPPVHSAYGNVTRTKYLWHDSVLLSEVSSLAPWELSGHGPETQENEFPAYTSLWQKRDFYGYLQRTQIGSHRSVWSCRSYILCVRPRRPSTLTRFITFKLCSDVLFFEATLICRLEFWCSRKYFGNLRSPDSFASVVQGFLKLTF